MLQFKQMLHFLFPFVFKHGASSLLLFNPPAPAPRTETCTGSSKTSICQRAAGRWKTETLRHCWLSAPEVRGQPATESVCSLSRFSNRYSTGSPISSVNRQHLCSTFLPLRGQGAVIVQQGHFCESVQCCLRKHQTYLLLQA